MIENLVPYNPAHFEALLASHRVDNHIPMYPNEVLAVKYRILVLASSINDLNREVLISISYDFAECIFDRWVIGIDKMAVYILDSERALACHMLSYMTTAYRQICCLLWPFCVASVEEP